MTPRLGCLLLKTGALKIFLGNSLVSGRSIYMEIDQPVVNEHISWCLQMIELSLGRCIYIYHSHLPRHMQRKQKQPQLVSAKLFLQRWGACREECWRKNGKQCVDTDILESILSKYNHNLTIILITIIKMFTLHEPVFERAA